MPSNYMTRSADLKINNFAEGSSNCDIAKAIVDHFAADNIKVLCVQQCANKVARVTFDTKLASEVVQLRGELDVGGVKVAVVPPPPPPPNWMNVVVYNYPYDAPNHFINDALKFFGTIQNVRFQHWTNLPEVSTGTRVVRINLTRSIPRFVKINSYRCKVWYRGQPVYCDICKEATHLASGCPYKGKCLSCKGVGHLARKCPTVCFKCRGDHASDACPNRRGWEHRAADDDDFRSVASDLGAADDIADPAETSTNSTVAAGAPAAGSSGASAADGVAVGSAPACVSQTSVSLPPAASDSDDRLNQLDELQTQVGSLSQSVLVGLSDVVDKVCESATNVLNSAVGSASESSSSEDPFVRPQDVNMSVASGARKREVSEVFSSDELRDRSRSRTRKARTASPHIPSGLAAAANLARSRSSSGSRTSSSVRSSSKT